MRFVAFMHEWTISAFLARLSPVLRCYAGGVSGFEAKFLILAAMGWWSWRLRVGSCPCLRSVALGLWGGPMVEKGQEVFVGAQVLAGSSATLRFAQDARFCFIQMKAHCSDPSLCSG